MEKWLPIKNFPNYDASDEGRIRNHKTGKIVKQFKNYKGYMQVSLRKGDKMYTCRVGRLIADTFCGGISPNEDVMYLDGDKENTAPYNLKIGSRKESINRAIKDGRMKPNDYGKKRVKVRVLETGKEYGSIQECARDIGCGTGDISNYLLGYRKPVKGYTFEKI